MIDPMTRPDIDPEPLAACPQCGARGVETAVTDPESFVGDTPVIHSTAYRCPNGHPGWAVHEHEGGAEIQRFDR